jgi:hypothetical protein
MNDNGKEQSCGTSYLLNEDCISTQNWQQFIKKVSPNPTKPHRDSLGKAHEL